MSDFTLFYEKITFPIVMGVSLVGAVGPLGDKGCIFIEMRD